MGIGIKILGTGTYFPKKILNNKDLEKIVDTSDEWIISRTGIKERRISSKSELTSDLAYEASKKAIKSAKLTNEQIDLIIVTTITPDMPFPATACLLQRKLGIKSIPAFDISASCSGFIYGLATAKAFIESGLYKTVLLVSSEELSKITDWDDRSTCILFGDGAGAMVLTASYKTNDCLSIFLGSDGIYSELLFLPGGGTAFPTSKNTVSQNLHKIKMQGNKIFKHAISKMVFAAKKALMLASKKKDDIRFFIPHQANIRIIESVAKKIGVSINNFFINITKTGNTSSASVITALDEAIKNGTVKNGDLVELIAFGSGLTWGAAVLRI
ncbi:MAG: ketoacyl-ACP synthase III [Endomicrobium sp.]|jgi:3-oxoacyl-[acyl-carrier-protein] synthase-3|nr:ketoacyl-ACP synthase III [Endomicrobium sp.]